MRTKLKSNKFSGQVIIILKKNEMKLNELVRAPNFRISQRNIFGIRFSI